MTGSHFGLIRLFTRKASRHGQHAQKKKHHHDKASTSSTVHEECESGTTSSSDSTSIHRFEGGRRYNGRLDVPYMLPNDEEENDRAHQQHWMINVAFGSQFDSPIEDQLEQGIQVLDSGCGPATWTLEMAERFPCSTFHGTDISPRFPQAIKPSNCQFSIHNIVDPLPFPSDTFTFIHQRLLSLGLLETEWDQARRTALGLMRTLKPGGWIELLEVSYTTYENAGPKVTLLMQSVVAHGKSKGLNPGVAHELDDLLRKAGAVNVSSRKVNIPINHGGKLGQLFWEDFRDLFMAMYPIFSRMHPELADIEDYRRFIDDIKEECKTNETCLCWYRSHGQKPF
ncbi:S-adenosyl-L-methionine-dependent methyltransferase [Dichotomocladium elegans]|nr:S-adenosyl-L-methionine-dependent methyltransferase [Dichotomocladium elegans]